MADGPPPPWQRIVPSGEAPDSHPALWLVELEKPRAAGRHAQAHALLRHILACQLECHPNALVMWRDARGKPRLRGPRHHLAFNLSHVGRWGLVATLSCGEVGVDIEDPVERARLRWRAIARRNFDRETSERLEDLDDKEGLLRFLAAWTRREAILKAHGIGLRVPLSDIVLPDRDSGEYDFAGRRWRWLTVYPLDRLVATVSYSLGFAPCG